MRSSILFVFIILFGFDISFAQDTLKVMSYNLLNFPNGRDDCGSNLSVPSRWDTLRKIVQYQKPDILMVCELQNEAGADNILNQALNVGSINYYARANFVVNQSGFGGLNNMFFYNTQKVILYSQSEILTDLRDIGEYVVYANDPNLNFYNDTNFIYFYVSHLKAGNSNSPTEENRRALECDSLRSHIDNISATGNFIFGGDFNFYTSSEPGYQILTTGGVNKLNDPINRPGNWNNNSSFEDIHTQSTRSSQSIECGAPGGMDDRFDFILISDSIVNGGDNVQYIAGSYAAFGNDGNHFNQSLNDPLNTSLPDSVINALYYMSDHLPVVMDLLITYPSVMVLSTTQTEITCNADCDGTGTATVAGGSPPYTYLWGDMAAQSTLSATGLCAGTFTFTFTDSTGTSLVDSIVLTNPAVLNASFSDSSIILCSGDSSGFATVSASGGVTPYTYLWDDPGTQTNATATGLAAGTYKAIVTDSRTCSDSSNITITQVASTPLSVNISASTNVLCNGDSTGTATASSSGGTVPYTFIWNDPNSQTDSIATGLAAGTYTATVTDSAGCPGSDTITITQQSSLVLTIMDTATSSCGSTDTYAAVTVSGGFAPYTYLWDDPSAQTTDTATSLASGIYKVIVTDSIGCVDSAQANVTDFSGPSLTITDSTNVACYGEATGSATVSASGGTPPYTYSWSPSGGSDTTANFLTAGTHTVTVIDDAPCTSIISVIISEPPQLTATFTDSIDVLCFGDSTGSATVTPVGGVPPYTYTWSVSGSDSIADSLSAGTYTVTVTDANSCAANGGPAMTNCFEITSILVDACKPGGGNEGENEMVRFEVGSSALDTSTIFIDWPNNPWRGLCQNATTSDIVDSINANITAGGLVLEPVGGVIPAGAIVMIATSTNFDWATHDWSGLDYMIYMIFQCPGNTSGHFKNYCTSPCGTRTLSIDFGGGCTDTVTYEPDSLTTNSGSGDGDEVEFDYNGNPTYKNIGCKPPVVLAIPPLSVTISEPSSAVVASITASVNVNCFGDSTGTANSSGSGGTPPYTYLWDDPSAQSDSAATGLADGNYIATVTDNNGCVDTAQITITQPAGALVAVMQDSTDVVCYGFSTGSAEIGASGGTAPYTYLWNDPSAQTNSTATSLSAGPYTAVVTDANGCQDSANVTISEPSVYSVFTIDVVDAHCGQSDGSATVNSTGGTAPYSYQWDDPLMQTDTVATGLGAGSYKVIVTDGIGCTDSLTLVLNDIFGPGINSTDSTVVACNGDSTGTASVDAGGGTEPYTYLWDDPGTQTDSTATGLAAGSYEVVISDNFGCSDSVSITVSELTAMSLSSSTVDASCGAADGSGTVSVVSGGASPFNYLWSDSLAQTTTTATGLAAGAYTATVTDSNSCSDSIVVNISNLGGPTITISDSTNVLCNGDSTGSATASISGGTSPYVYSWNDPATQTDSTASGLPIGTYTITVTDSNGCISTQQVNITEPTVLSASLSVTNVTCFGGIDGGICATVSGGTTPYSYNWCDGSTGSCSTPLMAMVCCLAIADSNGCSLVLCDTIKEPSQFAITTSANDESCSSGNGSATASVTGGSSPFTFSWNTTPVQTDSTATGLSAGTYIVSVIDSSGCSTTDTVVISNSGAPILTLDSINNVSCNGGADGAIYVSVTGGAIPYTYMWSGGPIPINWPAGTYGLTVADINGCTIVDSFTITEPSILSGIIAANSSTCGNSNGTATILVSGGNSPYTYVWNDVLAQTSSTAVGLNNGSYTVTTTDANGCTLIDSTTVLNLSGQTIDSLVVTNESCSDKLDGSINLYVSGGTLPYTFLWNDANATTTEDLSSVGQGTYIVLVTDSSGCTASDTAAVSQGSTGCDSLNIPSSFSPNGDGTNDKWAIRNVTAYPDIVVEIFNRWGSLLFSSTGYSEEWDGTFNGKDVALATYYYIIILNGNTEPITGSVTIVR